MARYETRICEGGGECKTVARSNTEAAAKKKAGRALKKAARKMLKGNVPKGSLSVEVRRVERGKDDDRPVYKATISASEPGNGSKKRKVSVSEE